MSKKSTQIKASDLGHYRVLREFRERLAAASAEVDEHPSFSDPKRLLQLGDYLGLMLLGLLNPVARTARGLVAASHIPKVQREICSRPVSLGSFSETQGLVDVAVLEKVFAGLSRELCEDAGGSGEAAAQQVAGWLAEDSTVWSALPRMAWALYRIGRNGDANGVRMHLSLHVGADAPTRAVVTEARACEREVLRGKLEPGAAYVADRYYGVSYRLFAELSEKQCHYCIRVRDSAAVEVIEELPVSAAEAAAGVLRQMRARLGGKHSRSEPLRLVHVRSASGEILVLATNLGADEMGADELAMLYKKRWQIEYFFRWVKCVMGCGHWMAESRNGVSIQIYLALIASLLLQLQLGRRPSKRVWELMGWHGCGMITDEELGPLLEDQLRREKKKRERQAARKKLD